MSEHESPVYIPRMHRFGWKKPTLNGHISLVRSRLPASQIVQWDALFDDPEGFIPSWVVDFLCMEYAERHVKHPRDSKYFGWELKPISKELLQAAFDKDWMKFDSIIGLYELAK